MYGETLLKWPYKNVDWMTPDMVWSAYIHEHHMRLLLELQLEHCAKRIHEQRQEIKRLALLNENRK